jgi:hypothetical protein
MTKNELTEMVRGTPNPNVLEKLSSEVIGMIVDVSKRTGDVAATIFFPQKL